MRVWQYGVIFLERSLISFCLSLIHSSILSEHGTIGDIKFPDNNENEETATERKHTLMVHRAQASEVLGKITNAARVWLWGECMMGCLLVF